VAGKKKVVKASVSVVKKFTAAFYSSLKVIPSDFADKVCELQAEMKMPVVLLWHGSSNDPMSFLEDLNYSAFAKNIHKLDEGKNVVVCGLLATEVFVIFWWNVIIKMVIREHVYQNGKVVRKPRIQ